MKIEMPELIKSNFLPVLFFVFVAIILVLSYSQKSKKNNKQINPTPKKENMQNNNNSNDSDNDNELILYHATWCGHCVKFVPTWDSMNAKYGNQIKMTKINCVENKEMCTNIQSFPTIKLHKGDKIISYNGDRTPNDIISFLNNNNILVK